MSDSQFYFSERKSIEELKSILELGYELGDLQKKLKEENLTPKEKSLIKLQIMDIEKILRGSLGENYINFMCDLIEQGIVESNKTDRIKPLRKLVKKTTE